MFQEFRKGRNQDYDGPDRASQSRQQSGLHRSRPFIGLVIALFELASERPSGLVLILLLAAIAVLLPTVIFDF